MTWKIDPAHSSINFTVRHMMISKVHGQFKSFSGTVNFDEDNPVNTTGQIEVDVNSIFTDEEQRDNHLKSPDFFDAANYPTATFQSTRVEQIDSETGKLYGNLTIKDITQEVVLDVAYAGTAVSPWGMQVAGFSATTTLHRKDWGLNWNQALETGGFLVGDKVSLNVELELIKQTEKETI